MFYMKLVMLPKNLCTINVIILYVCMSIPQKAISMLRAFPTGKCLNTVI